jgi:N-acetylglutamate synthase-like GNAT family acetyltransferase
MREANKFDIPELCELMRQFRSESDSEFLKQLDNQCYFEALMHTIIAGAGVIYIEEGKGVIIGVIAASMWCNKTLLLNELAWYVKPEYRNTTLGYRLLKKYIEHGKELKEIGRIKAFTMGKMVNSPNIKYEKFGFSKLEENWIQ